VNLLAVVGASASFARHLLLFAPLLASIQLLSPVVAAFSVSFCSF
jgi:hypothetical protein